MGYYSDLRRSVVAVIQSVSAHRVGMVVLLWEVEDSGRVLVNMSERLGVATNRYIMVLMFSSAVPLTMAILTPDAL